MTQSLLQFRALRSLCLTGAVILLTLQAQGQERDHPGWNHVSTEITLTKNEPAHFSAWSGLPKGVAPFTALDDGTPPGRPDPEGSGHRVLRGYLIAWAVGPDNEEIRWNHLFGTATIVNHDEASAWEYQPWSFAVVADVDHGEPTGVGRSGQLDLDGIEYTSCFSQLIFSFYAMSPFATAENGLAIQVQTDLTLHPVSIDLRQEDRGPVTTKARFQIWNENEVKFNGTERCITCWDQRVLEDYTTFGIPNSFLGSTLQTTMGKARIDGVMSQNCDVDIDPVDGPLGTHPADVLSEDAALLGITSRIISFIPSGGDGSASGHDTSGANLAGMGTQAAVIQYDRLDGAPPENVGELDTPLILEATGRRDQLTSSDSPVSDPDPIAEDPVPPPLPAAPDSTPERVAASIKGSLLIFSNIELRWDRSGTLLQDTFITLGNDYPEDVRVQMYFVHGDAPILP